MAGTAAGIDALTAEESVEGPVSVLGFEKRNVRRASLDESSDGSGVGVFGVMAFIVREMV